MQALPPGVTILKGKQNGPTSAIVAGVHGNERAGIAALQAFLQNPQLERGTLYIVFANPEALARNVRQVGENLNRCFRPDAGQSAEAQRARELIPLIDRVEAVLDLHASNSKKATPFAIAEGVSLAIAEKLPVSIVSTGWDALEPGALDGYAREKGKIGVCVECGSVFDVGLGKRLATQAIQDFLILRGHTNGAVSPRPKPKRVRVTAIAKKATNDFRFAKAYADFELLNPGKPFAWDGKRTYVAEAGQCIIFPRPDKFIGGEVFLLGQTLTEQDEK